MGKKKPSSSYSKSYTYTTTYTEESSSLYLTSPSKSPGHTLTLTQTTPYSSSNLQTSSPLSPSSSSFPSSLPEGMVKLASIANIRVKQKIHIKEVVGCGICEVPEHYDLFSPDTGPIPIFIADEESGCCMRNFCANLRGLKMHIVDRDGSLMFTAQRIFKPALCICKLAGGNPYCGKFDCCPCFLDEIRVFGPDGEEYGKIIESWSMLRSFYKVYDGNGKLVYNLQGPFFPCTFLFCCKTANFRLINPNTGVEEGKIFKTMGGIMEEYFTEADNFGVDFPVGIDVKLKAVLISGVFLIDMIHFEDEDNIIDDAGSAVASKAEEVAEKLLV